MIMTPALPTSIEQMKLIVTDIQKMVDDHTKTNEEGKVRFQEFGSSSLDILRLYFGFFKFVKIIFRFF